MRKSGKTLRFRVEGAFSRSMGILLADRSVFVTGTVALTCRFRWSSPGRRRNSHSTCEHRSPQLTRSISTFRNGLRLNCGGGTLLSAFRLKRGEGFGPVRRSRAGAFPHPLAASDRIPRASADVDVADRCLLQLKNQSMPGEMAMPGEVKTRYLKCNASRRHLKSALKAPSISVRY